MSKVQDANYIAIQGWMRNKLNLKGNDLLVYAIIYGYSQDGESVFNGSLQYLADWCGATKQGIQKNLKNLLDMGLIEKQENEINNIKFCSYYTTELHTIQQSCTPIQQSCTNNIVNTINNKMVLSKDNTIETAPADFQFGKQKSEKPNLYTKCISIIDEYTNNLKIRTLLIQYLDLCLEMKSIRGANQWKGMINTLNTIYSNNPSVTLDRIISQSIERGWKTFYPVNTSTTNNTNFSETTEMQSKQYKSKVEDRARDKNGNLITY